MSRLMYVTNMSLDGYIEDQRGDFNWENTEGIHPLAVELLQPVRTFLYGRRLYETMSYWETPVESCPAQYRDFARVWQKPEKIVYSRTLTDVTTRNTRIERDFDTGAVAKLKQESEHDITIGGAELAGLAFEAGLVDDCHLLVHPVILGGGKPAFRTGLRKNLELLQTRTVGPNVIHLHYRVR